MRSRFARGCLINQFCASLRDPHRQRRFYFNEQAYCIEFGLDRQERDAVRDRDFMTLIQMGAHVKMLDALAALSGLDTLQAIRMRGERTSR